MGCLGAREVGNTIPALLGVLCSNDFSNKKPL